MDECSCMCCACNTMILVMTIANALVRNVNFVNGMCQRGFDHDDSFKWFMIMTSNQRRIILSLINKRYQVPVKVLDIGKSSKGVWRLKVMILKLKGLKV